MSLTYEGVGQNHKWARQETYSGRLVENATQAIARDILAEAIRNNQVRLQIKITSTAPKHPSKNQK